MPIVHRTTTTVTSGATVRTTTIPIWAIKLLVILLCIAVLFIMCVWERFLPDLSYSTRMFVVAATAGALIGNSISAVLQQILSLHHVDMIVNLLLTAAAIASVVFCAQYTSHNNNDFAGALALTIIFVVQTCICILMLSWLCYGHVIVVRTR